MTISKAHWNTDGDNVRLSMPLTKVDKERRIVTGFASLDNLDKQDDIVTAEASLDAFKRFRGNIREMHQPSAVGKMVSFKQDKYFDPETKKFYNGVLVSAYISKGAQDAWEKVLDNTYTGFSIGGRMNKWDDAYDEKADKTLFISPDNFTLQVSILILACVVFGGMGNIWGVILGAVILGYLPDRIRFISDARLLFLRG